MAFFFVLSQPPDGISDAEYTAWYDVHHAEVLQLPAFVGAQRFPIDLMPNAAGTGTPFRFLVRYEVEGDFDAAWAQLRAAVDSGTMTFPEWYGGVVSSGYRGGDPVAFGVPGS